MVPRLHITLCRPMLVLAGLLAATHLAAQTQPCDVHDDPVALDARSLLYAEAQAIIPFGTMESGFRYLDLQCVGARWDQFELDFQGDGANLTFTFDAHGLPLKVRGRDALQFVWIRVAIAEAKQRKTRLIDAMKKRVQEQGGNLLAETWIALLENMSAEFEKKKLDEPENLLPAFLQTYASSAQYPRAAALALRNKYIANLPIQTVFITPQEAAAEQSGKHKDYAAAFQTLDWKRRYSTDNPGRTRIFPAGTRFTPVLDGPLVTNALDSKAVLQHIVKGVIGRDLPVPYSSDRTGNAAYLVEMDDGVFAMIAAGAMLDPKMMEPYKFEKPPVPLTREERTFRGSIGEFVAALPKFMERAATAAALNPRNYEKVTAFTIETAKACDSITPEMARSVTSRFGIEDLHTLGKQYEPCQGLTAPIPESAKTWKPDVERSVVVSITPVGGRGWRDRKWMSVVLQFTPLNGDSRPRGENGMAALFDHYGIVAATITEGR